MSSDMMKERFAYVGRRVVRGKVFHAFRNPANLDTDQDDLWYSRAPQYADVGGIYEVDITPDHKQAHIRNATRVGAVAKELRDQWRLLDQANRNELERGRALKRLAKANGDFGSLTLDQVSEMMRSQPQHVADGTLVAVMRYLTRMNGF